MSAEETRSFEGLIAWQKARALTKEIYKITVQGELAKDWGLRDQIRRSAVSIMSNIAEGHERASPAEFCRFLLIAKGSCGELRSQLYVAMDTGYLSQEVFRVLHAQAEEVGRIVGGLRASIQRKKQQTK